MTTKYNGSDKKNPPELPIGRFLKSKSTGGNRVILVAILPIQHMKRPHRFEIVIEPAFTPPTRYSIEHGKVSLQHGATEHRSATPTLAQWSGFWRLCEFLDLWNWRAEYTPEAQMRDGQSWHLSIAYDKSKQVVSSGHNGYPSLESIQTARTTMDRFGLLLHFADITLLSARYDIRDDYNDADP